MSQHKDVVKQTLDRLYQRIDNPTARDREFHRVARLAVEQLEPEPPRLDLDGATIAQVQSAVEGGDITVADALAFEQDHDQRKTLIAWLEERD